jgi:hypothetical protein
VISDIKNPEEEKLDEDKAVVISGVNPEQILKKFNLKNSVEA